MILDHYRDCGSLDVVLVELPAGRLRCARCNTVAYAAATICWACDAPLPEDNVCAQRPFCDPCAKPCEAIESCSTFRWALVELVEAKLEELEKLRCQFALRMYVLDRGGFYHLLRSEREGRDEFAKRKG